ncbi:PREDICTED: protein KINKY POLLEN isoform X2 [Camelina sativa]|uniref:Protein KINKY POLLEN isoform X2 n=1 Tax=Camelina sativa TaxID=90675 RepID=A0ABM0UGW0_CAMSA|nr:PREDICTED: protein KINKY POLLEN isoform X2 [Camelina sativa]
MVAFFVMFIFTIAVIVALLWAFFKSLPWILQHTAGITLSFQFDRWNCLKDVSLHFKKGSIESVFVGEFKANLSQSLVELCATAFIHDPKVIFSIFDLKIVTRPSNSSKGPRKSKTRKPRSGGKGKLMLFANIGRFFSVSMTNTVVQTPKATAEIKELELDISKDRGSGNFFIKLYLLPIFVQIGEPHVISTHSPEMNSDISLNRQTSSQTAEGSVSSSSSLHCEKLSLSCEFGHNRQSSPSIKNVEVDLADAVLNLNEKLLLKKKSSTSAASTGEVIQSSSGHTTSEKPPKQPINVLVAKHASKFPEKVLFDFSKLEIRFVHQEHGFSVANSLTGLQLRSAKTQSGEDGREETCLDFVMELRKMHLFRESEVSVLEMTKFGVFSKVYCPIQESFPLRAEVEIKLESILCNIIMTRFEPLLRLHFSKKKKMVLKEETPNIVKSETTGRKAVAVVWKCATSAPDVTVVLYNPGGSPIYQCGLDSFQVTADNMSTRGTVVQMELNELNLCMVDEHQGCLKESLFGLESTPGSLVNIRKVRSEMGKKPEVVDGKQTLVVDVSEVSLLFSFRSFEALVVNAMSIQAVIKSLTGASTKNRQEKVVHRSKPSGRGTQLLKLNVERFSLNFAGDSSLENTVIDDPKRVNYGSQGGRVIISVSADGTPRTATVFSTLSKEHEKLKYIISFELLKFSFTLNKEIQSTQVELEKAKSIYQEFLEEPHQVSRVTLCDIQNAKFVRHIGGAKEVSICSLFSASNIAVRWEPDVHISMVELGLRLKSLILTQKLKQQGNGNPEDASTVTGDRQKEEPTTTSNSVDKKKKKESIFAVDVEMLSITAEAGDGVEAEVQIQSIFSENVGIGVLLEGFMLGFCGCRIVKSSRVQISRIPSMPSTSSNTATATGTPWDWLVQGVDIHICMPFRLQLRAIDDAVEEMLRALKIVTNAKTKLILPKKKESSTAKEPGSKKFGRVRFGIRKLIFDIEEEPLQGWLDEHYHLMRKEAYELAIRSKFLDELISSGNQVPKTGGDESDSTEKKFSFEGEEIDTQDPSIIQMMNEKLCKQSFSSYYKSCQSLRSSDGSGACKEGFQAGFKMSTSRTSLLSVSVTDLDLSLTAISGGEAGMIEIVKKLDPISEEKDIPFSRLYGSNLRLNTGTLAVQIRNYTFPLLSTALGKCEGLLVLAQQATAFQPQVIHDVYIGRWRKVQMLRSASGTTPAMKTYLDLPVKFQKGEVSFGIGYEPVLADISYAFTVAMRRANLSLKGPGLIQPPKKEKSLPWWDEMRNYIHGNITLSFSETKWIVLATPDPYEKLDKLQMTCASVEIQQSDGRVHFSAEEIKIFFSSFEGLARHYPNPPVCPLSYPFLEVPRFSVEVRMDWECESGSPLNHYLFALPIEGKARDKIYDPFRSTSLSLRWDFTLRPKPSVSAVDQTVEVGSKCKPEKSSFSPPTINIGAHDLAWLIRFWNMNYLPPYKLRTFSRWPRFGVPRIPRSGNLSLDRVMTEYMLRLDVTPICIKHMTLDSNNPAKGLTFDMTKLKYEICFSRGNQEFTFDCKRETLDPVYQGIDLHLPKAFLRGDQHCSKPVQMSRTSSQSGSTDRVTSDDGNSIEKHPDDGFLFSSDYFTIRRQAPKADPERLMVWKEEGKIYREKVDAGTTTERRNEPEEDSHSDPSDDDGYNVVIADNCQRIFVYGLKLLWNIENRDAVLSFAGGLSKAFQAPKPSPSRQYAQRKLLEGSQKHSESEVPQDDPAKQPSTGDGNITSQSKEPVEVHSPSSEPIKTENFASFPLGATKTGNSNGSEEEGTRHFMVNVVEPQFNLHSEDINGRFLLAAASGRVLARSFHQVVHVAYEMIEKAAQNENDQNPPENGTDMTWTRMEVSMMLEHVQAHVAPTDVDPGAGVQWLPKIRKRSPKAKRTGALLERVFMPCDMYFQYTRHKGVTPDLKVKPLKELTFNSRNITASMTSRQFQVMSDVLSNLLLARLPKAHNDSLKLSGEEDDEVEEEIDEVVPDGIEEVELAKIELEKKERDRMSLLDDIRKLTQSESNSGNINLEKESDFWMITGGRPVLVEGLRKAYTSVQQSRKTAYTALRTSVKNTAELRLLEKDKNKRPSSAMRISLQISKVIWSMVLDGKTFAEVEIDNMIYDFNRDYRDIGIPQFTTRYVVLRNCLPNAKCDTVLSAWNPPPEWGKKVMLQVDARQGIPKDGQAPYELFQVEIYPLKIHLTETMYTMMWEYIFPGEEQHSQRREEVWKVSTTSGSKRVRKGSFAEAAALLSTSDLSQGSKNQNLKSSSIRGSGRELRRTSSFDRSWEETVAESVATELVLSNMKDSKTSKAGRSVHEEKKGEKSLEDKKSRPQKIMQFQTIKISQVELLITYEGSRFVVNDMKLLMDTFHRVEFSGTWRRLFSRVKKHIIWGVLKSVTGMQMKKFKDKTHVSKEEIGLRDKDESGRSDQDSGAWEKRPGENAGDGFVTSIRGIFNTQRRKAKKFVLRTMRGEEEDNFPGEWSDNESDFSPFARQLTITKAKKLIRRHSKKFQNQNTTKGSKMAQQLSPTLSPSKEDDDHYDSDSSSGSSAYEEFLDQNQI